MAIRVIIFDDNLQRRESLTLLFNSNPEFECAGVYENGLNALKAIKETYPDVVLMDIEMPERNGIEALKDIRSVFPDLPVMMQTVFDDDEKVFESILQGATGYMLKETSSPGLLEAVREAVKGNSPMTPSIAKKVLKFFRENKKPVKEYELTAREMEILQNLVSGKSYKMIAAGLNISSFTVNDHIKKIYQKLQVHSASEAVSKAIREQIVK
jgi:DNA-binding NarL/FixJ family response regulator